MTKKEAEMLLKASREAAEPDMDKLWAKIEDGLSEKQVENAPTAKRRRITLAKCLSAVAVCAAAAIIFPFALSPDLSKSEDMTAYLSEADKVQNDSALNGAVYDEADNSPESAQHDLPAFPDPAEDTVEDAVEDSVLSYGELKLADGIDTMCRGSGSAGVLFEESDVLAETDCFIDGVVESAYEQGEYVCYELRAIETFGSLVSDVEIFTVSSRSEIPMLINREYLIPLKSSGDGLRTVVESVPQIEITLDGGAVFYNGWKSLDDENARDVLFNQSVSDDFFYDRMRFSYTGYKKLLAEWQR